jgi:hypothetical protein
MRTITFLIVIILISFINLKAQHTFPLHIGDKWIYWNYPNYYDEYSIDSDTVMDNGKLYFNLQGILYRQEGDSVYTFDHALNDEYLIFDFSADSGDTVTNLQFGQGDTLRIILINRFNDGENFGVKGDIYTYYISETGLSDGNYSVTVMDGLGIIHRNSTWYDEYLHGAIINNTEYGNVNSVKNKNKSNYNFKLNQNYPNPFNPNTIIEFTLNEPSKVNIKVYDILGNLITTLLDDYRNAGLHKLEFNGKNLSSGIYFYTINVNGKIKTKSMVLQK